MLGAYGVRQLLHERLVSGLPGKLAEIRTRYSIANNDLPDPQRIEAAGVADEIGLDVFPAIYIVMRRTDLQRGGSVQVASDGFSNVYQFGYIVSVFAYVRGYAAEETENMRDLMVLAVRELFMQRPQLTGFDVDQYLTLDPEQIEESYSDVTEGEDREVIGAATFSAQWVSQETLASEQANLGPISAVESTVIRASTRDGDLDAMLRR